MIQRILLGSAVIFLLLPVLIWLGQVVTIYIIPPFFAALWMGPLAYCLLKGMAE